MISPSLLKSSGKARSKQATSVNGPMAKRVTNLPRYYEISARACRRYLDALCAVDDPREAYGEVRSLTRGRTRNGRRARGFNPLREDDAQLFAAVLHGEHLLDGFRNKDIVRRIHPAAAKNKAERHRRSRRVTRLLGLLRSHGLIARVPRSRRYQVTTRGIRLMSSCLFMHHEDLPQKLAS